jgi:hypothetical protein
MMNKHVMNILDQTGHTTHGWNPDNETEVALARDAFNNAKARGYSAFHVTGDDKNAKKGERMTEFDPNAERMMLLPQLQGG